MMFVRIKDNKSFTPELPSEFMKENNLDRSACHKVAKGTAYKLKDQRHGGEYKTVLSQHKGFRIYYL